MLGGLANKESQCNSMEFRPAKPEDLPQMERVYLQCVDQADWMPEESKARINFARETEGERLFVVSDGDSVLGFAAIWEPESFIHHLYVRPDVQRSGIGRLLLQGVASEIPLPLRLKCLCANHRARLFYLSLGWKIQEQGLSESGPYWLMQLETGDRRDTS